MAIIRKWMIMAFVIVALGAFAVLVFALDTPWFVGLISTVFGTAMDAILVITLMRIVLRKIFSGPKYQPFFGRRTAAIDEEEFRMETDTGIKSTLPQNLIKSASIVKGYYVLSLAPQMRMVVPENSFASEADRERFQRIVREKIPKVTGF